MGKYDPLSEYLSRKNEKNVILRMQELEQIIGDNLPKSAYKYVAWWGNSNTKEHLYSHAWTDCGYRTVDVYNTIHNQMITFEKI